MLADRQKHWYQPAGLGVLTPSAQSTASGEEWPPLLTRCVARPWRSLTPPAYTLSISCPPWKSLFFSLLGPWLLWDFLSAVCPSLSAAGGVAQAQKHREWKNQPALGMATNSSPSRRPGGFFPPGQSESFLESLKSGQVRPLPFSHWYGPALIASLPRGQTPTWFPGVQGLGREGGGPLLLKLKVSRPGSRPMCPHVPSLGLVAELTLPCLLVC